MFRRFKPFSLFLLVVLLVGIVYVAMSATGTRLGELTREPSIAAVRFPDASVGGVGGSEVRLAVLTDSGRTIAVIVPTGFQPASPNKEYAAESYQIEDYQGDNLVSPTFWVLRASEAPAPPATSELIIEK